MCVYLCTYLVSFLWESGVFPPTLFTPFKIHYYKWVGLVYDVYNSVRFFVREFGFVLSVFCSYSHIHSISSNN